MAKTDGYITDNKDGDWRYSNTGSGSRGDITNSVEGDAFIRVERKGGAIPGTKVDEQGQVSAGPTVTFTGLNSLLSGAPAAAGKRPWIVWAGISPLSLSEVLIVWNAPIVLLDQSKISATGTSATVSVAGRVMVVKLGGPASIDGQVEKNVLIKPGAVGIYIDKKSVGCDPESNTTVNNPGGSLEPITSDAGMCDDCGAPTVGDSGSDGGSGSGANVLDSQVFAEQLCQADTECDPALAQPDMALSVNNGMRVPTRCCHPFMLQPVFINGSSGDCACKPAPVWMVCLYIFGSTCPLEVFSMDQLVDVSGCSFETYLNGGEIPGTLVADTDPSGEGEPEAGCCVDAQIEIVGTTGPAVRITGEWRGEIPGVAGQPVYLKYKNSNSCGTPPTPCVSIINSRTPADTWTEEGIIKPKKKPIPIKHFAPLGLKTITISLPDTLLTTNLTLVTSCPKVLGQPLVTGALTTTLPRIATIADVTVNDLNTPAVLPGPYTVLESCPSGALRDVITSDGLGTPLGNLVSNTTVVTAVANPVAGAFITGFGTTTITLCEPGGATTTITVVTSITTAAVTPTAITGISLLGPVLGSSSHWLQAAAPACVDLYDLVTAAGTTLKTASYITTALQTFVTNVTTTTLNIVTDCTTNPFNLIEAVGPVVPRELLALEPDNPDFSVLKPTTVGCDAPYKLLASPGPATWQRVLFDFVVPCGEGQPCSRGRLCIKVDVPHPAEANCAAITLLAPNWVSKTETEDSSCPGYDCSPELKIAPPKGSDIPNGPGGPVACGILIRRPRRRPFLRCHN